MNYGESPEMVMDAFRMARSGDYANANLLVASLKELYPAATAEQIRYTILKLAEIIEKQNAR